MAFDPVAGELEGGGAGEGDGALDLLAHPGLAGEAVVRVAGFLVS